MTLSHDRPTVLCPPEHVPTCCRQKTLTVPVSVNAKTAQKYDYPSAAWRASYARRTAVERSFSTIKDPASNDISRGWCRLMGLSAITVFLTCCLVVRNWRVLDAFEAREADDACRAAAGLGPRRRKRRRRSLAEVANAGALSPAPTAPRRARTAARADVIANSTTARLDLVRLVPGSSGYRAPAITVTVKCEDDDV